MGTRMYLFLKRRTFLKMIKRLSKIKFFQFEVKNLLKKIWFICFSFDLKNNKSPFLLTNYCEN
ncbi:hypothetical protein BpHYR1_004896 [Brachionus plicatilis]|uniref:Uncharacterized protein n=1 Tax=Brachionus plicatilis TaxID=10195 RepID=A0A3M7RQI8_BRAPC|nr:hypothetical protein BpHYR1_004896 [Brachionus plicatilis]